MDPKQTPYYRRLLSTPIVFYGPLRPTSLYFNQALKLCIGLEAWHGMKAKGGALQSSHLKAIQRIINKRPIQQKSGSLLAVTLGLIEA